MTKLLPHNTDFTRLFILRHAQTDLNADGKIQGETDAKLNQQGRKQAKKLAKRLSRFYQLDQVYASPYPRAQETAQLVAQRFGIGYDVNADLAELNFGKINNQRFIDLATIQPDYYAQVNRVYAADPGENIVKPSFPQGESTTEIQERIQRFTQKLLEQHRGECVAAVSHGGFIKYMLAYYAGIPLDKPIFLFIENTSISVVDFYQNRAILMALNDFGHLDIPLRYSRPSVL